MTRVIVIIRFEVSEEQTAQFTEQASRAIEVLQAKVGLLSLDFGRNVDEPRLWTLTTRWKNVGSYRRALGGLESKMIVVPMLSLAIDEPSAYDEPDLVGENQPRVM